MQFIEGYLAEHCGKLSCRPFQQQVPIWELLPFSVNVIYTDCDSTLTALRAADSLAGGLGATVHIRVMVPVPRQLEMELGMGTAHFVTKLLRDLVARFDFDRSEFVVHLYGCRSRLETLLSVLPPSSLLLIGGRRHFWPTAEGRIAKALTSGGHNVVFVDQRGLLRGAR